MNHPSCAVCGSQTASGILHWNTPTGSTLVADSCSEEHSDIVEAARDSRGRLTVAAVARLKEPVR